MRLPLEVTQAPVQGRAGVDGVLWARQEAAIPSLSGFHQVSSLSFPQPRGVWGGVEGVLGPQRRSGRGSGGLRSCWHLLAVQTLLGPALGGFGLFLMDRRSSPD